MSGEVAWLLAGDGLVSRVEAARDEYGDVEVDLDDVWLVSVGLVDEELVALAAHRDTAEGQEAQAEAYRLRYERCAKCGYRVPDPDGAGRTLHVIFHEVGAPFGAGGPEPRLPAQWHVVDGGRLARVDLRALGPGYEYGRGLRAPWVAALLPEAALR